MTRDRIEKHSETVNTPKKKGLVSSNLRKNRPMTSGDISIKSKPTRLTINENGRILKHTRMNAFDSWLTKTEDLYKTKNGPNRQYSTQKVSVDFSLKDVLVKRNANASKSCKYKSYNLINAQKSEGKLIQARNDLQGHNDTRENFLVNKNHVGKINRIPDTPLRSAQAPKLSEGIPKGNANHMTKDVKRASHDGKAVISDQEAGSHEERPSVVEENWSKTLKSCRYLRKPRGKETPEIPIESIFQND